jgi:hypothetical protein
MLKDIEYSQTNVTMALKDIPQQALEKYFQRWQHRWVKSIAAQGEYLEGDPSQSAVSIEVCSQLRSFRELHSHT